VLNLPDGTMHELKLRSMVGLIPLFAVETIEPDMLRRLPRCIRSVVRTLAATSHARILPSIQVQEAYREGEPLTAEEFSQDLREALRPPSAGVVLWSWDGLQKEPEKQRALRAVLAQHALAP